MSNDFAQGLWFNDPRETAPSYVLGELSIDVQNFTAWLNEHDEDGKVRVSILRSQRTGKPYCQVNTWRPDKDKIEKADQVSAANAENDTDAPF